MMQNYAAFTNGISKVGGYVSYKLYLLKNTYVFSSILFFIYKQNKIRCIPKQVFRRFKTVIVFMHYNEDYAFGTRRCSSGLLFEVSSPVAARGVLCARGQWAPSQPPSHSHFSTLHSPFVNMAIIATPVASPPFVQQCFG